MQCTTNCVQARWPVPRNLDRTGLDYVIDLDRKGEVIGVEVLNMEKALALASSESTLLLAPMRAIATKQP